MTERLADVSRRIAGTRQLDDVVAAMRGIAASRVQNAHALMAGVRAHAEVIGRAIGQALPLLEADGVPANNALGPRAVVLFCAEQGFAGAFSDRMLKALSGGQEDVLLIGTRGGVIAAESGVTPVWQAPMVSHARLMPVLADRIAEALYDWISRTGGRHVDLLVPRFEGGSVVAERRSLLPFDYRRFNVPPAPQPPLTMLPPRILLRGLAEEYVVAALCEAVLTAFAVENEARVAMMLSAGTSLDTKLEELRTLERQVRQEEITAEVVSLASSRL